MLRSLQHADFDWAGWYAYLDAFSKLESTRTRVATLLADAHSACARAATGLPQPARSDQRASISIRACRSRTRYACCDCPRPPAPSYMHARDGPRAHGPLTRIRLAGHPCNRCAYRPQNACAHRLRITGRHARPVRCRQWSERGWLRCFRLRMCAQRCLSTYRLS